MESVKQFDKMMLSMENVIIPTERLLNTPSMRDGMSRELEVDLRVTCCEYIQSAGILLKLPQVAMATAQILFHRFYYAKSFVKFNCYYSIMACMFLAAKIEENSRRLRDVINVFHHLRQKRKGSTSLVTMDYVGEEYFHMRNCVNKYERYILKELGFCVHVQHPHKLIIACLQILELEQNLELAQRSWNYMNDGLRTNIFVRYTVQALACSCVFLAARQLQILLPSNPPWWELFDTDYSDIKSICLELIALYKRPKKYLHDLEKEVEKVKQLLVEKEVEKTEQQQSSSTKTDKVHTTTSSTESSVTVNSQEKSPHHINTTVTTTVSPTVLTTNNSQPLSPVNGQKRKSLSPPPIKKRAEGTNCKPIISPIRLSSGDSEEEEERLPLKYQTNSPKHSRHYRSHKRDRHRRSVSRERRKRVHSKHSRRDHDYDRHHYRS